MYNKVIIIGAPRSGTNMLRDILTCMPSVATWPCDEINYIWRHGNVNYPSDEIPVTRAVPAVKDYIQKQFDWVARRYQASTVIEKTCANSLRVPFVDRAVSDAKYIFIYRDGLDTTGSAKLRWTAQIDIPYILAKVRFVPVGDLPYYGVRYLRNRMCRLLSPDNRLAFWGPILDGMTDILAHHSLDEVCALQWKHCVDKAEAAFAWMPDCRVLRVRYEDFVRQPEQELARVLEFIQVKYRDAELTHAVSGVSTKSIGKGRVALTDRDIARLVALVGDTLDRYGYRD